jgi:uncharacterized protein Yka (UPF0111/DUF47 family)
MNDVVDITECVERFVSDSMDAVAAMRNHIEEFKRMDKSLIMRAWIS